MRIAIFSDIHGSTPGLRAVLAAIAQAGADLTVAAGDLVGGGPGTDEIFDLLDEHGVRLLRGNWEEVIYQPQQVIAQHVLAQSQDFAWRSTEWLQAHLSQANLSRLPDLPVNLTLEPAPGHPITICHAAPGNPWSRTCAPQVAPGVLLAVYGGEAAEVVAYGHFHAHHTLWLGDKLLVNVAAVGMRKDGLSAYTLIEYSGAWQVRQYLTPYDTAAEKRLTDERKPPWF